MRNGEIADAIDEARKARGERTEVTADRVLRELGKIAFADMRNIAGWDPDAGVTYHPSELLEDDVAAAISEVSNKKTDSYSKDGDLRSTRHDIKVRLHDKTRALELIGKHLGMFKADEAQDQSQVLAKVLDVLAGGGISMDQIVAHLSAKKPA